MEEKKVNLLINWTNTFNKYSLIIWWVIGLVLCLVRGFEVIHSSWYLVTAPFWIPIVIIFITAVISSLFIYFSCNEDSIVDQEPNMESTKEEVKEEVKVEEPVKEEPVVEKVIEEKPAKKTTRKRATKKVEDGGEESKKRSGRATKKVESANK